MNISGVRSPEPSSSIDVRVELVLVTSVPGVTEGLSVASLSASLSAVQLCVIAVGFSVLNREDAPVAVVFDESAVPVPCEPVVITGFSVLCREVMVAVAVSLENIAGLRVPDPSSSVGINTELVSVEAKEGMVAGIDSTTAGDPELS